MVSLTTPVCDFNADAINFDLPGVDGQNWNLEKAKDKNGLLVMFISNHCPYVKAIHKRLVDDTRILRDEFGVNSIAIMSNDPNEYAEDSFENPITQATFNSSVTLDSSWIEVTDNDPANGTADKIEIEAP